MMMLLPLLSKLAIHERVMLGRTLSMLGTLVLAAGLTGHPWHSRGS